jgi:hypothetical protein
MITFLRGKRPHLLLDLDTMTMIPNVKWADEAKGRYGVYRVDAQGRLILTPEGNPGVEERTGNIKIIRVVQPGDYRILSLQETAHDRPL